MKLTKSKLKQIIQEEVANNIKEFLEDLPEAAAPMWNRDETNPVQLAKELLKKAKEAIEAGDMEKASPILAKVDQLLGYEALEEGPDPMWQRDDVSNLPASMSAHRFSATPVATLADVASQKDRIKELHTLRDNLLNKINQYVEDYQNVGPAGESDFGGLRQTPQWIELYDFLKGMQ